MKFITGKNRQQVAFYTQCLDDTIAQDPKIRLIDLFVDSLNLADYGSPQRIFSPFYAPIFSTSFCSLFYSPPLIASIAFVFLLLLMK